MQTAQKMFELHSEYKPTGDQPQAIEALVKGFKEGNQFQTLLGVTGSGKTFTMANVIAQLNKPTLVIAHNKTLAAQLYGEFKEYFPSNAVEYFVSYYDYYQPEAYIPHTDTFIEKDASINEEIDRLGYRTTPLVGFPALAKELISEGHELFGVPGFYRDEDGCWTMAIYLRGIMIPCRDRLGRIQSIHIRLDKKMKKGGKFLTFSSIDKKDGVGAENWCHIAGPVQECVYLIEGYMKADIVHFFTGQTVLAIPGVTSLHYLEKALKELTQLGVRHVMTCFDMDYLKNWHVEAAYGNLIQLLGGLPLTFGTYLWSPDYNGLDDYIWEFFMRKYPLD